MLSIFKFWLSLAATYFFMALELPLCTAFISKLENSEINLAAIGIVAALAIFIQSPVLRLTSLPLLFIKDSSSYKKICIFSYLLSIVNALFFILISLDPLYSYLVVPLLNINEEIASSVQIGLLIWAFFPVLIGLRRFYQGIILLAHEPRKIGVSTFIRLVVLIISLCLLSKMSFFNGIQVAIFSLGLGIIAELIASRLFANTQIKKIRQIEDQNIDLKMKQVFGAFIPLSISSCVAMGTSPISSMLVARSYLSLESLILSPVIFGLMQPFTWAAFAMQDSTQALMTKNPESYNQVRRFAFILGGVLSLVLFTVLNLTCFSKYYFLTINSLSVELYELALFAIFFMPIMPITIAIKNFYRGVVISSAKTKNLLISEVLDMLVMVVIFYCLISVTSQAGINLALISMWLGNVINIVFLYRQKNLARVT